MAHSVILKPFQGPFAAWEKEFDLKLELPISFLRVILDSGPCCGHNTGHVDAGNRKVQILIRGVISPLPGVISGVLVTLLSPDWRSREIRVTPLAWVSWCHHRRLILYLVKPSQIMRSFWERYRINISSFGQYAQLNLNTSEHQTRISCIGSVTGLVGPRHDPLVKMRKLISPNFGPSARPGSASWLRLKGTMVPFWGPARACAHLCRN